MIDLETCLQKKELCMKAYALAKEKHEGQVDKAGKPYLLHLGRVANAVEAFEEKTVAYLHDILEDTDVTVDELWDEGFPMQIVEAVQHITKKPHEPYKDYIKRVLEDKLATKVKIADLKDNMDLTRLPDIKPEDLERNAKYERALNYLTNKLYRETSDELELKCKTITKLEEFLEKEKETSTKYKQKYLDELQKRLELAERVEKMEALRS